MVHRRNLLLFGLLIAAILLLAGVARRQTLPASVTPPQNIIITQSYELTTTVADSLVVIADSIRLNEGSRVRGDAALVGRGLVRLEGQIDGNLTVMSDVLEIGKSSRVTGDVAFMGNRMIVEGRVSGDISAFGQALALSPAAPVGGRITACVGVLDTANISADQLRPCREQEMMDTFAPLRALRNSVGGTGIPAASLLRTLPVALALAAVAALVVAAFPGRFSRIEEAVRVVPHGLARTGCLLLLVAIGLAAALVTALAVAPPLGLVLLPVGALLGLVLLVMGLVGWITLALVLGRRLPRVRVLPPLIAVIPGSLALCLLAYALALLPFGMLFLLAGGAALAALGLGGAFITRFGAARARRYVASG
ncbi:MAG: polymer-forming cytoskeletal protein [Chloroflexi bacterium]|nr:polymer-forming cytoskeletal protein [Chloroflexota bacterium]